jgi:hypothetical protein
MRRGSYIGSLASSIGDDSNGRSVSDDLCRNVYVCKI